jgi:hypothetical protein
VPIVIRVASFFAVHATYYLNGYSFLERELTRNKVGHRKDHDAFLPVDNVAALQTAIRRNLRRSSQRAIERETCHVFQDHHGRFACFQAQCLKVYIDFPLCSESPCLSPLAQCAIPASIHDVRAIRIQEVLLHAGNTVGGWTATKLF